MKAIFVITLMAAHLVFAQAPNSPASSVLSSPAPSTTPTNTSPAASLLFTNQSGTTYSIAEVDRRLTDLKSAVDQVLPALTAFNQNYRTTSGGNRTIDALGGVLSDVLSRRGKDSSSDTAPAGGSTISSNLVGVLQGLFNTNKASFNPDTLRQLQALEKNLEPVMASLQALNVQSSETSGTTNSPPLTPTGRDK